VTEWSVSANYDRIKLESRRLRRRGMSDDENAAAVMNAILLHAQCILSFPGLWPAIGIVIIFFFWQGVSLKASSKKRRKVSLNSKYKSKGKSVHPYVKIKYCFRTWHDQIASYTLISIHYRCHLGQPKMFHCYNPRTFRKRTSYIIKKPLGYGMYRHRFKLIVIILMNPDKLLSGSIDWKATANILEPVLLVVSLKHPYTHAIALFQRFLWILIGGEAGSSPDLW
jgi:hypothetical protein